MKDLITHINIVKLFIYILIVFFFLLLIFKPIFTRRENLIYWSDRLLDQKRIVLKVREVCIDDRCFTLTEPHTFIMEIREYKGEDGVYRVYFFNTDQ